MENIELTEPLFKAILNACLNPGVTTLILSNKKFPQSAIKIKLTKTQKANIKKEVSGSGFPLLALGAAAAAAYPYVKDLVSGGYSAYTDSQKMKEQVRHNKAMETNGLKKTSGKGYYLKRNP
jgi:hypothetical protein